MISSFQTGKTSPTIPSLYNSKTNIQRNLSFQSNKSNSQTQPRPPRKSVNKNNQKQKSYIAKAYQNIQKGCYDQKTGQLKIDGQYGDYKMKLFRKKDKNAHYNDPNSIFNNKQFSQKLWEYAYSHVNKDVSRRVDVSANYEELTSPLTKKLANRSQRVRLGMKRNNSNISPLLKHLQVQKQKTQQKKNDLSEKDLQLTNKMMDILSKPKDFYFQKQVQNQQEEQAKRNMLRKGIQQQLRQKQGHLFYRSIPQYMAQKWFKTLDNSTAQGNKVTPYIQQKQQSKPPKKPKYTRTHLFRFMENNCKFNLSNSYTNNSMIVSR